MKIVDENEKPLYSNVDELHAALVSYAIKALAQTFEKNPDIAASFIQQKFVEEANERFAQVAGYLWMELEGLEDRRGKRIEVDGKPLSSLEEAIYGAEFVACCRSLARSEFVRANEVPHAAVVQAANAVLAHRSVGGR